MNQTDLFRNVLDSLERLGLRYMVVGSYASITYGEPRFTQDIDIVIDLPASSIDAFCASFPEPDFYLSKQAVQDAVRKAFQFNVLHLESGNKIDFILPRQDAWGTAQLIRCRRVQILSNLEGYVACPEDVILGKLWYYSEGGSEKHLRDISGILRVSGPKVDQEDIANWAKQLGLSEVWQAVLSKLQHGS